MAKYLADGIDAIRILKLFGLEMEGLRKTNIIFKANDVVTVEAEYIVTIPDKRELETILKKYRLVKIED